VFPFDLSARTEPTFTKKLVKHPKAVKHKVSIEQWNGSELIRRLAEHPDLRNRFFPDAEGVNERVLRGVQAGGKLENTDDLVERARTLNEYAQQRDPNFAYRILTSPVGDAGPAAEWPDPPYLQVKVSDGRTEVELMAWPRASADIEAPSFAFTADVEGEKARADVIRTWARGEQATISSGARIRFVKPELLDDFAPGTDFGQGGTIYLAPPDPFDAVLQIITADGQTREFTFDARVIPPPAGCVGAIVGQIGDVFVEINVSLLEDNRARATFNLSAQFVSSASRSRAAAELLVLWAEQEKISLRSAQVYRGGIGGSAQRQVSDDVVDEIKGRLELYRDLSFIEDLVNVDLPMPLEVSVQDVAMIATAAKVLRTGTGDATFNNITVDEVQPAYIPRLIETFNSGRPARRDVTYEIFGKTISLGLGDYTLPKLKIVSIIPHGTRPTDPARVVIGADDSDQMTFTLLAKTTGSG
jgi:hypothetical protein